MYIALNYEERADFLNEEETTRVASVLIDLEREEDRLEFHIALLPPVLADMLRLHYVQGVSWKDTAKRANVSQETVYKRRSKAISMLAEYLFQPEDVRR